MSQLSIVPYHPDHLPQLARAFASVFHVHRSTDAWRQRFSYANCEGMLAFTQGVDDPVAFYGAMVHRVAWRGRTIRLGHIVDAFSHQEGRQANPNAFKQTAEAFLERYCGSGGLSAIYGFPSIGHFRLGERYLGYRRLHAPRWFEYALQAPMQPAYAVSFAGKVIRLYDFDAVGDRIRSANAAWLHFDQSAQALAQRFPLRATHVNYLAYGLQDTCGATLTGLVIVRLDSDCAKLLSLHIADQTAAFGFWARVANQLIGLGATRIIAMTSEQHPLAQTLTQLGFTATQPTLSYVPAFCTRNESLDSKAFMEEFVYDCFHTDIY